MHFVNQVQREQKLFPFEHLDHNSQNSWKQVKKPGQTWDLFSRRIFQSKDLHKSARPSSFCFPFLSALTKQLLKQTTKKLVLLFIKKCKLWKVVIKLLPSRYRQPVVIAFHQHQQHQQHQYIVTHTNILWLSYWQGQCWRCGQISALKMWFISFQY